MAEKRYRTGLKPGVQFRKPFSFLNKTGPGANGLIQNNWKSYGFVFWSISQEHKSLASCTCRIRSADELVGSLGP